MERRRILALAISFVLVIALFPAVSLAADYSDGTYEYTVLTDGTLSITKYNGSGGDITIPSSFNPGGGAIAVTTIATNAFTGSAITSVTIPPCVTTIEGTSFNGCSSLRSVMLSEGLSAIGAYAFFGCDALESVTIPASLTSIGQNVFERCHHLSSVTLSDGLTVIGSEMFYYCTALESITIPASVTSIGDSAFQGCSTLRNVTLSNGLTTIGGYMFLACTSLESIAIPTSVTSIGYAAFASCGLKSVAIPDSVTSMGTYVFNNCASLSSITIGSGLTALPEDTFSYCTSLISVTVPANITSIGESVFEGDTLLQRVVIAGKSVTFGDYIFLSTNLASDGIYGFSGSAVETYASNNGIPFHALIEVTYDSQGGSSVPYDYVISQGDTVDAPADPTRTGYVFGGWYPTAACDTAPVTFPYTVTGTTTLYAKWTELTLTSSDADGKIYTGGRVTLTPNIEGGDWDWDAEYFSATFNSPATFTGLKAGTSTITYTVEGVGVTYNVTIEESELPATGQDMVWVWVLCGAALALAGAGMLARRRTA